MRLLLHFVSHGFATVAPFVPGGNNLPIAMLCLFGAEVYRQTNAILAEKLYRRALKSAIQNHGFDSPTAGLVLLSFGDFLEGEGRTEEAQSFSLDIQRVCARIVGNRPEN